ncbi:hypothetical protein Tco_0135763, partial [Tanacetum coccineum]
MADEMRPECDDDMVGQNIENDLANWVSNNAACLNGTGIIIGWDSNAIRVMVISQTSQLMNLFVESINGKFSFYCTFVYAHNITSGRKALCSSGSSIISFGMEDFRGCLDEIGVSDRVMSELKFTWNKSP